MNHFSKYDRQIPDFCARMKDGTKIMLIYRLLTEYKTDDFEGLCGYH